jgi:hypothetical protein
MSEAGKYSAGMLASCSTLTILDPVEMFHCGLFQGPCLPELSDAANEFADGSLLSDAPMTEVIGGEIDA